MAKAPTLLILTAFILTAFIGIYPVAAELPDSSAQSVLTSTLENNGINDVTTRIGDGRSNGGEKVLVMSYRSYAASSTDLIEETAKILGAYIGLVKADWDCDSLMVVVGTASGGTAGTWYCTKEWKNQNLLGYLTDEELIAKALGSMESWS